MFSIDIFALPKAPLSFHRPTEVRYPFPRTQTDRKREREKEREREREKERKRQKVAKNGKR